MLNDDLILLRPAETGWHAWATPFGRRRDPGVRSAPLRALLHLVQAPDEQLEVMPPGVALAELIANSPVINADSGRALALITRCEDILRTEIVRRLRFSKADTFWEVIDAHVA